MKAVLAAVVVFASCAPTGSFEVALQPGPGPSARVVRSVSYRSEVDAFQITSEIDGDMAVALVSFLSLHPGPARININSPGGGVFAAYDMFAAIEKHGDVTCVVDGMAASAAFAVLQSCQHRTMTARSLGMAHDAAIGGLIGGQSLLFRNIAERLRVISEAMAHQVCQRATMPYAACRSMFADGREHWVTAQEALAEGFADSVK